MSSVVTATRRESQEAVSPRWAVLRSIAEAWNSHGINYVVTNGLEAEPFRPAGPHLEVFIDPRLFQQGLELAQTVLKEKNWSACVRRRRDGWSLCAFGGMHGRLHGLRMDLRTILQWGPFVLSNRPWAESRQGVFPVDSWAVLVTGILIPVLQGQRMAARRLRLLDGLAQHEKNAICTRLAPIFGGHLSREIVWATSAGDADRLQSLRTELRQRLALSALLRDPWLLPRIPVWIARRLACAFGPSAAVHIEAAGASDPGNSAVIESVRQWMVREMPGIELVARQQRQAFRPPLKNSPDRPAPNTGVVVAAGTGPELASHCVRDLVVESFVRDSGGNFTAQDTPSQTLARIESILVDPERPAACCPSLQSSLSPRHHHRSKEISRYCVLPSLRNPSLLVPRNHIGRTRQWLTPAGLASWIASIWNTASLSVHSGMRRSDWRHLLLEEHLKEIFADRRIGLTISVGGPGVHQIPSIHVMNREGRALGRVKAGWNHETVGLVQHEEAILRKLGNAAFTAALVPRVRHSGWWSSVYLLVQDPVEAGAEDFPRDAGQRHMQFLWELHAAFPSKLLGSANFQEVRQRIGRVESMGFAYYTYLLETAMRYVEDHLKTIPLRCGFRHGNFVPWNAGDARQRLCVVNWEYAEEAGPPGADLFQFVVEGAAGIQSAAQICESMLSAGRIRSRLEQYFERLNIPAGQIGVLFVLYLTDALSRSVVRHGRRANRVEEELRSTWAGLLLLACGTGGRMERKE